MNNVLSATGLLEDIQAVRELKKGFLTNYYHDPVRTELLLEKGLLFSQRINDTLFILRQEDSFFHLHYCSVSANELGESLKAFMDDHPAILFTIDLIGNQKNVDQLGQTLTLSGFYPYVSLVRMSRLLPENPETPIIGHPHLIEATSSHALRIGALLKKYFDPLAENFPLHEEILARIDAGQIIVYEENGLIEGFLIYEINGLTSYLRYWFVHPDHREKKIGSILIQEFFRRCSATKRQIFWVIRSNENAIKRYIHYGFSGEDLIDQIYTNQNIRYGRDHS